MLTILSMFGWLLSLCMMVWLSACIEQNPASLSLTKEKDASEEDKVSPEKKETSLPPAISVTFGLKALNYNELEGWSQEDGKDVLAAFQASCTKEKTFLPRDIAYNYDCIHFDLWKDVCSSAKDVEDANVKAWLEETFLPYQLIAKVSEHEVPIKGRFTGYYIPLLKGSTEETEKYRWPAYGMPPELKDGSAERPYFNRKEIDEGALKGRGLEILWLDDPVMLFFAQVQGSAFVELPDGERVRLKFAGKNGLPYTAIGRTLIERDILKKEEVTMPAIRDWLYANPNEAAEVMQTNASYIFFSLDEKADHVVGAQGVPLTPERSLAVDKVYIPLGLPVFVSTQIPDLSGESGTGLKPYHRLMLTQDTGSAIKGIVRGDIFYGYGEEAGKLAGRTNASGSYTLLLPRVP